MSYSALAASAAIGAATLAIIALAALHILKPDLDPSRTKITIMSIVGPGKTPSPDGPERFLGWPNRLFMVAYGVWLIVVAWPMAR